MPTEQRIASNPPAFPCEIVDFVIKGDIENVKSARVSITDAIGDGRYSHLTRFPVSKVDLCRVPSAPWTRSRHQTLPSKAIVGSAIGIGKRNVCASPRVDRIVTRTASNRISQGTGRDGVSGRRTSDIVLQCRLEECFGHRSGRRSEVDQNIASIAKLIRSSAVHVDQTNVRRVAVGVITLCRRVTLTQIRVGSVYEVSDVRSCDLDRINTSSKRSDGVLTRVDETASRLPPLPSRSTYPRQR